MARVRAAGPGAPGHASGGADVAAGVRIAHRAGTGPDDRADVAIVGGGIIGLAIAWELVRSGRSVRVIDPHPARGATYAAAGMLAPASEFHYGEEHALTLGLAAAERYPAFVDTLPEAGAAGFEPAPTLVVGVDDADRAVLADLAAAQARLGLDVAPIGTRDARRLEPLLGPRVGAAYLIDGDHRVDPRALAAVLRDAIHGEQADAIVAATARRVLRDARGAALGVELADGGRIAASEVVVANALGAARLAALPEHVLRPVHGDILRLRAPEALRPLLTATVRGLVRGAPVYLVPRRDGTVVLGATQREHGGPVISAGGVHALLRDARELLPAVDELELVDAVARSRPATPDHVPLVGRVGPGLLVATGTHRNGVLLAPLIAELCRELVEGAELSAWPMLRPDRFAPASATARSAIGSGPVASHLTRSEEHA
ncbi:glycine oxidase ThiO [Agromyces sp. C10]|uniref:glycine oxidase ThiO n=1 Tax=Agromyces sp. C10 TaxID=2935077 RepID=UPI00200B24A3|nr:glycine oxidase ThiO [Agromyces sp. C10]MCK8610103.1 glycine oxidase ThiO [Agromyces sp. C10]